MGFVKDSGGYKPTDGRVYAMAKLLEFYSHSPAPAANSGGYLGKMLSASIDHPSLRKTQYSLDTKLGPELPYTPRPKALKQDTYIH